MTTKVSLLALRQYVYTRQKATFSIFSNQVGKQSVSSLKENIPGRIKVLDQIKTNNAFPINRRFSKTTKGGGKKRKYVPRKAAVKLTDNARTFFNRLLENNPEKAGIMLYYKQASSGQPRMVFSFGFVADKDIESNDEGVSLEVDEKGDPVKPEVALEDGKQKLYINSGAFLKVLGATVDIDLDSFTPILYDREGNKMDPNA